MQNTYSKHPFINRLMGVEHILCTVFNWVCALILFVLVGSMFLQVLSRFIFKSLNVPWTDELARYMWISITYTGMGIAISKNDHVEISLISSVIAARKTEEQRQKWARVVDIIRFGLMMVLACFLIRYSWPYMMQVKNINMLSSAMQIPIWWLDAVLVVGCVSMALHSLIRLIISIVDDSAIVDPICLGKEEEA